MERMCIYVKRCFAPFFIPLLVSVQSLEVHKSCESWSVGYDARTKLSSMSSSGAGRRKRRKSTGDLGGGVNTVQHGRAKSVTVQSRAGGPNLSTIPSLGVRRSTSGFLDGVCAFFVQGGTSAKRLQIWRDKLVSFGGSVVDTLAQESLELTHVLATDQYLLSKLVAATSWLGSKKLWFVQYRWIEDCLKDGKLLSCEPYVLSVAKTTVSLVGLESEDGQRQPAIPQLSSILVDAVAENIEASGQPSLSAGANGVEPAASRDGLICGREDLVKRPLDCGQTWDNDFTDEDDELDVPEGSDTREGGVYEPNQLNADITRILREMWHIYEDVFGDEWRALTYKKAGNRLARLPYRLTNVQQLKSVKGLGKSVSAKVKEIITTGRLEKLENFLANEQVQTIRLFSSVWGIGPKLARRLYQAGCRTLQDVERDPSLTQMSKIGLKYYDDLMLRIPRDEVAEAEKLVVMVAEDLCAGVFARVTGSYRRGQPTCGDIDVLITHPDGQSQEGLLAKLVDKLTTVGFLTAGLSFHDHSTEGTQHQADSFMGICKLAQHPHHRRIDMKAYPKSMYAFALLYFTGNDVLNRRLRYTARLKGYKLNDCGLFLRPSKQKAGASTNITIPCETENDIFEKLGFTYPEPHERNW